MPKGHYERTIRHYTNDEFLVYLLRQAGGPRCVSDLYDRMHHRLPDRKAFYDMLRRLETRGAIVRLTQQKRGGWYEAASELAVAAASPQEQGPP